MKYINPHTGQTILYTSNQQQAQPMQQQPTVVMTPQGPMLMTPQGLVPVNLQYQQQQLIMPQYQPMGMMMNPNMFQQQYQGNLMQGGMNQAVMPQSRFTTSNVNEMTQNQDTSSRYQTTQPQQQNIQQNIEKVKEESMYPELFTVKPTVHKFIGNENVKLNVITDAIKVNRINHIEDYIICDCLEEAIESITEKVYESEEVETVTICDYIINNIFYKVNMNETIDALVSGTIKDLYKAFKSNYAKITNKYQINMMNAFNIILTDTINDFLAINSQKQISIESFYIDFNDLLKVIRDHEEDLEDILIDYLNKFVTDIRLNLNIIKESDKGILDKGTVIPESFTIVYLDKHVLETGLNEVTHKFVQVDENIANVFINSLRSEITERTSKQEFLLVTLDKNVFKFMVNSNNQLFIRKIT